MASAPPSAYERSSYLKSDVFSKNEPFQLPRLGLPSETSNQTAPERKANPVPNGTFPRTEAWIDVVCNTRNHNLPPKLSDDSQPWVFSKPRHSVHPIWQINDAPVNRVISDYLSAAREHIALGNPVAAVLGPEYVDVHAFFQPRDTVGFPTVSEWASEINKGSVDVDVCLRLAHVLLQTHLMRVSLLILRLEGDMLTVSIPVADPAILG